MDLCVGQYGSLIVQILGYMHLVQIFHQTAAGTDEVDMGGDVSVEPFHTIHAAQTLDHPLLLEKSQVPINGAKRDIRHGGFQTGVNRLG